ncbi:MAG: hypothetical protein AB1716_22480, partial [Planctomycetota bacterium]
MYRRMARAAGGRAELPGATYLAVSRHATYLASLDRLDLSGLDRLLRQYPTQTLGSLLRNVSVPAEEFLPLAARYGPSEAERVIDESGADERLKAFLADAEVQRCFTVQRDKARAALTAYLRQKGFFEQAEVGLVDIGWKGSIQDNLYRAARHAPDCPRVHGLYFGLMPNPADDLPGATKAGWLADTRRGDYPECVVLRNGPVFEMFASAPHGGVVGYAPRRPGGPLRAVIRTEDVERRNVQRYARAVFAGIEAYMREYLEVRPLLPGWAADWKPDIVEQLRRYILYPTRAEARRFLEYSHAESFGVFHTTTYECRIPWRRVLLGGGPLGLPRRLIVALERQFWPESHVRRTGLPGANFVFDLLETRFAARALLGPVRPGPPGVVP